MTMDLRLLLAELRWGDTLTKSDREFIKELDLFQVLGSSYLLPKTARVRTSKILARR